MSQTSSSERRQRSRLSLGGALGWFVVSYGFAVVGYLVMYAVAGRFLGRDSFGYFAIIMTATSVVGQLALLGVDRSGLRDVPRMGSDDDEALGHVRAGVRSVCLTTLPAIGALSGVITWVLLQSTPVGQRIALAVSVAVLTILSGHQKLWASYLRGFGDIRFASLLTGRSGGALVALVQAVLVAAVWLLWPRSGLTGVLVAIAVGYLIPVLAAYRVVLRHWSHARSRDALGAELAVVLRRDWRFASGQLSSYLNANLELWMAGALLAAGETSLFGAAQRLSLLIVTPLVTLQGVVSPVIARHWDVERPRTIESMMRTGATVAAVPMMLLLVPILIVPGHIMGLVFGQQYAAGSSVLLLLSIGSVANVLTGLCGALLTMTHEEGLVAVVQWWGLGARVVIGVGAALLVGLPGLAASAGMVTAVIWVVMWLAARYRSGVWTQPTLSPQLSVLRQTQG